MSFHAKLVYSKEENNYNGLVKIPMSRLCTIATNVVPPQLQDITSNTFSDTKVARLMQNRDIGILLYDPFNILTKSSFYKKVNTIKVIVSS